MDVMAAAAALIPLPPNPHSSRYVVQELDAPHYYMFCEELAYARLLRSMSGRVIVIRNAHTGEVVR
jgi:hypothetical protein